MTRWPVFRSMPMTMRATIPYALFKDRQFTAEEVMASRFIYPPLRLLDCSPVCDGAAAVLLAPLSEAEKFTATAGGDCRLQRRQRSFQNRRPADPLSLQQQAPPPHSALQQAGYHARISISLNCTTPSASSPASLSKRLDLPHRAVGGSWPLMAKSGWADRFPSPPWAGSKRGAILSAPLPSTRPAKSCSS